MSYLINIGRCFNMAENQPKTINLGITKVETKAIETIYKKSFHWKIKNLEQFSRDYTLYTQFDFCTFPKGPIAFDMYYDIRADMLEIGINHPASTGYDSMTGIVRIKYDLFTATDGDAKNKIGTGTMEGKQIEAPWRCKRVGGEMIPSNHTEENLIVCEITVVCVNEQSQTDADSEKKDN